MSEAWGRVRRRYALLEEVLDAVERSGVGALRRRSGEIEAEYGDAGLGGFLVDVQRRWQRAFDARLDMVLEHAEPEQVAGAVADVWTRLSAQRPATRAVLDAYAGHPALEPGEARHGALLRAATGMDLTALHPTLPGHAQTA